MKGILFAIAGGALITLQGVANARISHDIGSWQMASVTHLTGFLTALFILVILRDRSWSGYKKVKPLYLIGGTFGAVVVFSIALAINEIGVTLAVSALLISQLVLTFFIDSFGWFGVAKQEMKWPQIMGIAMMITGVVVLKL